MCLQVQSISYIITILLTPPYTSNRKLILQFSCNQNAVFVAMGCSAWSPLDYSFLKLPSFNECNTPDSLEVRLLFFTNVFQFNFYNVLLWKMVQLWGRGYELCPEKLLHHWIAVLWYTKPLTGFSSSNASTLSPLLLKFTNVIICFLVMCSLWLKWTRGMVKINLRWACCS